MEQIDHREKVCVSFLHGTGPPSAEYHQETKENPRTGCEVVSMMTNVPWHHDTRIILIRLSLHEDQSSDTGNGDGRSADTADVVRAVDGSLFSQPDDDGGSEEATRHHHQ